MQEVSLSGSPRENVGKKDAKAVRREGRVPAVIYGTGKEHHLSVRHVDLQKLIFSPLVFIINIDLEGTTIRTVVQDVQIHPVTDRIVHADFIELQDDKKVKIEVPVTLKGRPLGVINGGKMSQIFRKLKVYGLPGDLPDSIDIDVTQMKIGGTVKVKDLQLGGLTILHGDEVAVCSVKMARGALDDEEEEEEGEEGEEGAEGEEGEGGEGKSEGGDEKKEGGDDKKEGGGE